jgi:hypothetical protein
VENRWQHELAALQETLGRAGYDAAWQAGRRLEVEEAIRTSR